MGVGSSEGGLSGLGSAKIEWELFLNWGQASHILAMEVVSREDTLRFLGSLWIRWGQQLITRITEI